jgi:hypothetical protein
MRSVSSALRVRTNRSAKQFAWATRRNPDRLDAHIGKDRIQRRYELASPVAAEEPEFSDAIAEVHHEVADLLGGGLLRCAKLVMAI